MTATGDASEHTPGAGPTSESESRSILFVMGSSALAALILGLTLFLLVRGFQWRAALADLRAEPGIEVMSVERAGFFRKRLLGLRDPLAPTAESILRRHGLGPHAAEVALTAYHSLNTAYAEQREEEERARFENLRRSVVDAAGAFASSLESKRDEDLEKITRMLFHTRFPDIMESVELARVEDGWRIEGELYAPDYEAFTKTAPEYIVDGELDLEPLVNLTDTRTAQLRERIESADLFATDLDGEFVHIDRVARLVNDYDEVCRLSDLPPPRLRLVVAAGPGGAAERLAQVKRRLIETGDLREDRFLLAADAAPESEAYAHLELVPKPKP